MRAAVLAGAALFSLAACGGSAGTPSAPGALGAPGEEGRRDITSGSALERFFPLVHGMIYQYATENDLGEPGLLIARVARADEKSGELRFSTGVKRFSFASDGVVLSTPGGPVYLLKEPLVMGTSFRGEHGGVTRIQSTSAAIDVPAGHFDGCVQTIEERGGDQPIRYATTFCPAVGVVLLEVASGRSLERAALKSYAEPEKMKPDGVERFEVSPPPGSPAVR